MTFRIIFIAFFLISVISFAEAGASKSAPKKEKVSAADFDKMVEESMKMANAGHNFADSLFCPDGSSAHVDSIGMTRDSERRKIDHYQLSCADGTKGSFDWSQVQQGTPPVPAGFRLK